MMTKNKIIVALDVDNREKAISLVKELHGKVGAFKIGLELLNSCSIDLIKEIQEMGESIFFDAKFHDIPNTVSGAVSAVTRLGVWMMDVHCSGGLEMMRSAKEAAMKTAKTLNQQPPLVLGVTLLTSINQKSLNEELGISGTAESQVLRLAQLAKEAGLDGVVCSGQEIEILKKEFPMDFKLVVPGIRSVWVFSKTDQKRVMTPKEAIMKGADYLVIGRPIIQSESPKDALEKILDEIS